MIFLGEFYPTCAYSTEVIYMYLARELYFGGTNPDDDEFIETQNISLDELIGEILNGNIRDGKTQAAVLKAYYLLKNERRSKK